MIEHSILRSAIRRTMNGLNSLGKVGVLSLAIAASQPAVAAVSVIAGNGNAIKAIDGAVALTSSVNAPIDVAVDSLGNVYFIETVTGGLDPSAPGQTVLRKIDAAGVLSTVALAANAVPVSIMVDANDNLYVIDAGSSVDLNTFTTVAHGVYKYAADGTVSNYRTGFAACSLIFNATSANDMALDAAGNLYVSNVRDGCVAKIDPAGVVTT
ncbi:MAG: hypothetical protein Q9N68_04655, partial [Gammaproteobacteria bacterium]|nr:hypothetical protein [Gammaproteobacteria bacterium]